MPVTYIGEFVFSGSGIRITSVVIPGGVKEIGKNAFRECSDLTSVTLPENIAIGESAFKSCKSLQSIEIPKGCTLKEYAFHCCSKLESVTLPEDLKVIPEGCFMGCCSLANIKFPSTLKYIGSEAFGADYLSGPCPFTSVELPEGLEYIESEAFNCNTITSVSLPKSLKWVEYGLIIGSNNISTITIAKGCAPKVINGKDGMDGRDIIKGASIDNSVKLQKQLSEWKLTPAQQKDVSALYEDLLSYGIGEE